MRSELESFFDQRLSTFRGSANDDDSYGGREAGSAVANLTDVPCEVYPGAAHVVDLPDIGQLVNDQTFTVTVAVGTDILKGDKLVITSQGNLTLRVNVVLQPESQQLQMHIIADREVLNT